MCRVLDIPLETADEIAKSFELYEIEELDALVETGEKIPENAKEALSYVKSYPDLFRYVRKLNGLPKSFGLHACGKIISTRPLDEFLPSSYDDAGVRYLQGDMHDVEDVGLVKIDVLGLRTLDQEYDTLEMSDNGQEYINPKEQDYSDPKVLSVFKNGDTTGIFQFSSYGMKETLKKMDVRGIEDLAIANALYRPGAMSYIDNFCNRRKGKEKFEYLHPDLEGILKNTYGILVFQEQLIEIGRLAKIHNPDLLRKATGKKDVKLLNQVKPELEEKLKARGWTDEQFETLWSDMLGFAKYSFNKCVSGKTKLLRAGQKKSCYAPTVEEMYLIKNDLGYAKRQNKLPLRSKYLRGYGKALSMDADGRVRKNSIVDIRYEGERETWKVSTDSGAFVVCTSNHKFPTPTGIKKLEEMNIGDCLYVIGDYELTTTKYNFTDGNYISNIPQKGQMGFQNIPDGASVVYHQIREQHRLGKHNCEVCGTEYTEEKNFELHHKNKNRTNNRPENLVWCCNSCHKKEEYKLGRTKAYQKGLPTRIEKIVSIEYMGIESVYDIEMAAPSHNFVTESGLVVSNSHAAAYAILAYITAKQKAYYPAEFFAGLCNSYIGESSFVKDTVGEIMDDVTKHRIRLAPMSFRNDHRKCSVKDGRILYAIPLIRDCNEQLAEALYSQRNTGQTYFWRLLRDLYAAGAKKSQVNILIKLDFFSEYGNAKELLRIYDIFEYFKQGDAKVIKKDKLIGNEFLYNTVAMYSKDRNDKGEELKSFKILDIEAILDEVEAKIKTLNLPDFDYKNKMADQMLYLGFTNLVTDREEDRPKLHVKSVAPLKRKKDKRQFGYSIVAKSLGSGIETRYTVMNSVFNREPVVPDDIIYCKGYEREGQYFKLTNYQKIF